jgi:hypothetical protein
LFSSVAYVLSLNFNPARVYAFIDWVPGRLSRFFLALGIPTGFTLAYRNDGVTGIILHTLLAMAVGMWMSASSGLVYHW